MCKLRFLFITLFLALFVPVCCSAADWITVKGPDGIVIECQPQHQELANKLIPEVAKRQKELDKQLVLLKSENKQVHAKKDKILKFLYSELAIDPSKQKLQIPIDNVMFSVLDSATSSFLSIKHLKMWPKDMAVESVTSGQTITGWNYNFKANEFIQRSEIRLSGRADGSDIQMDNKSDFGGACNLILKSSDNGDLEKEAISQIDKLASLDAGTLITSTFHEAAELSIVVQNGVQYPFRRWFCDGMANCIAIKCSQKFFGKDSTKEFIKRFSAEKFVDSKDKIDLLTWRAGEWNIVSPVPTDPGLEQAGYAFATTELLGLIDRHGDKTMPDIFKEIRKTAEPDEDTIFNSIKKVTNEDFRQVLSKYGSNAPKDKVSRLAIAMIGFNPNPPGTITDALTESPKPFPLDANSKCNFEFGSVYATPDPPINMKVEVIGLDGKSIMNTFNVKLSEKMGQTANTLNGTFKPGHYILRVYFEDKF